MISQQLVQDTSYKNEELLCRTKKPILEIKKIIARKKKTHKCQRKCIGIFKREE